MLDFFPHILSLVSRPVCTVSHLIHISFPSPTTRLRLSDVSRLARLAPRPPQVAQIIDVDIVPERCRRVRLLKHGSEKPLGFYIRDGTSLRVTPSGLEKVGWSVFT